MLKNPRFTAILLLVSALILGLLPATGVMAVADSGASSPSPSKSASGAGQQTSQSSLKSSDTSPQVKPKMPLQPVETIQQREPIQARQ